jgi:hypothetical protein
MGLQGKITPERLIPIPLQKLAGGGGRKLMGRTLGRGRRDAGGAVSGGDCGVGPVRMYEAASM